MSQKIREIMTSSPVTLDATSTAAEAAKAMRDRSIGDVLVMDGGALCGVVTDRDLTVRVLAEERDPARTMLREVCSGQVATLSPEDDVDRAIALIREQHVRRIPIVENNQPVGIISLGDLAIERDGRSALADVSAAAPTR